MFDSSYLFLLFLYHQFSSISNFLFIWFFYCLLLISFLITYALLICFQCSHHLSYFSLFITLISLCIHVHLIIINSFNSYLFPFYYYIYPSLFILLLYVFFLLLYSSFTLYFLIILLSLDYALIIIHPPFMPLFLFIDHYHPHTFTFMLSYFPHSFHISAFFITLSQGSTRYMFDFYVV